MSEKCLNFDLFDYMMDCDCQNQSNPLITKITVQTIEKVIINE